jgi:hypothetical protein
MRAVFPVERRKNDGCMGEELSKSGRGQGFMRTDGVTGSPTATGVNGNTSSRLRLSES